MRFEGNTITLCRKGSNCGCPTITPNTDKTVSITDDFGGKINITEDEFLMMSRAVSHYKKSKKLDKNI